LIYPVAIVLGLILGSFFNVLIHRMPRHESIVTPGSRCPYCSAPIKPRHNIPVLSYLILRGRCAACGRRISPRYPIVEVITPALFAALVYKFWPDIRLLSAVFLASVLLVAFFTDLETRIIPNGLTYPALVVALGLAFVPGVGLAGSVSGSLWGLAVAGGGLMVLHLAGPLLFKVETMGLGDVKLGAVMGLVLGWKLALVSLYTAFFLGAVVGIGLWFKWRGKKVKHIPFGPFLVVGGLAALWYGDSVIAKYCSFLLGR